MFLICPITRKHILTPSVTDRCQNNDNEYSNWCICHFYYPGIQIINNQQAPTRRKNIEICILLFLLFTGNHQLPTVEVLSIGTDRCEQIVQTQIRLFLMEQSDQGLHCLLFNPHLFECILAVKNHSTPLLQQ